MKAENKYSAAYLNESAEKIRSAFKTDLTNFYNPKWIAIRYCVSPEQLKGDSRLSNTEGLIGKSTVDDDTKNKMFKYMDKDDLKQVEYFDVPVVS